MIEFSNEELDQMLENAMEAMFSMQDVYQDEEQPVYADWEKDLLTSSLENQSRVEKLVLSYLFGEDMDQAKDVLKKLLTLQPTNPVLQLYLALAYYVTGGEKTAYSIARTIDIHALTKSRTKNEIITAFLPDDDFPVDFPAILDLSVLDHTVLLKDAIQRLCTEIQLYSMLGNHQKAITGFQQLIAVMGESSELLIALAEEHSFLKQHKVAKKLLIKALKYDPQSVKGLYLLATTHRDLKEYEQAIGAFKKYLKLDPTAYVTYIQLALCYEELQLTEKAVAQLDWAMNYIPQLETTGWRLIPQIEKLMQIIQERRLIESAI